jgi:GNAT superfamily N-acetyltransferase
VHEDRLVRHLRTWLGAWPPPDGGLLVTTSPSRVERGWDGDLHRYVGVATPAGGVLSVPPEHVDALQAVVGTLDDLRAADLAAVLEKPGAVLFEGVFRWSGEPTPLPDAGRWVDATAPDVPDWLLPFGGQVLMAFDEGGHYIAGVGVKRHDDHGHELAVVTEGAAQGKGLARGLVAQAARHVIDQGAVPTYLHADSNVASAHVADAAGFPDLGWRILGIAGT